MSVWTDHEVLYIPDSGVWTLLHKRLGVTKVVCIKHGIETQVDFKGKDWKLRHLGISSCLGRT